MPDLFLCKYFTTHKQQNAEKETKLVEKSYQSLQDYYLDILPILLSIITIQLLTNTITSSSVIYNIIYTHATSNNNYLSDAGHFGESCFFIYTKIGLVFFTRRLEKQFLGFLGVAYLTFLGWAHSAA